MASRFNQGSRIRQNRKNQNNNQNSNNNNSSNSGEYVKRTGCDMKDSYIHKSGEKAGQSSDSPVVYGWRVLKDGIQKFVAVLHSDPECKSKKTGKVLDRWLKMVVTITPPNGTANKFLTTGFWDAQKQRLHMPDLNLIANPGKSYWGRNYKPSN